LFFIYVGVKPPLLDRHLNTYFFCLICSFVEPKLNLTYLYNADTTGFVLVKNFSVIIFFSLNEVDE